MRKLDDSSLSLTLLKFVVYLKYLQIYFNNYVFVYSFLNSTYYFIYVSIFILKTLNQTLLWEEKYALCHNFKKIFKKMLFLDVRL